MAGEVMTAREAAEFLQVAVGTVKRKAAAGELPASKVGNRWRFLRSDLESWLRRGGSRYEAMVAAGMYGAMLERQDEPTVPWEQVKSGPSA